MAFTNVPIVHTDECLHHVCIECTELSKSFEPDARGCRLCTYARARFQHAQCDINGCTNLTHQIKQYIQHVHGLCYDHTAQIEKLHTLGCNICYAQKNPGILDQYPHCQVCNNNTDHIDINVSCTHHLCATCKNKSDTLSLDTKVCKQCTYAHAHAQHTQCNIDGCDSPTDHIIGHGSHSHGLCDNHSIEMEKLHTRGCTICYRQKNPGILNEYPPCEVCKGNTDHINVNASCTHHLCALCKHKSDAFYPTAEGCRVCTYLDALLKHVICDIKGCEDPADHITRHRAHTHGLCDQHNNVIKKLHYDPLECKVCYAQHHLNLLNRQHCEACPNNVDHINVNASCTHHLCNLHNGNTIQFHYSPIDYVKNLFKGNNCTTCFIKDNPKATSCVTETRYWGEIALLAGAAAIIAYGTKKIYTWWKNRKEKQEVAKEHDRSEEKEEEEKIIPAC